MARETLTVLWVSEVWGCPPVSGCEKSLRAGAGMSPWWIHAVPFLWRIGAGFLPTWYLEGHSPTEVPHCPPQTSVSSLCCSLCLECLPCVFWAKSTYLRHSSSILSSVAPALSIQPGPPCLEPNTPWSLFYLCLVAQSCQRFVTPWTISPQAPLSMGILQARILEWVAMPSSRGSSQPRNQTQVSCIASGFFTIGATREAQGYWNA